MPHGADGRPRRLEVDGKIEFRRQPDRQVGGLFVLEAFAGVDADFYSASVLCCGACNNSLGPPACYRCGTRVPIRTALVVFAIVRLAGDAANA
jgi:hypothetical protein